MKQRFFCVIALLLAITLSACYPRGTPAQTKLYAPYCILNTNAPFADNLHNAQWDNVSILEEDHYGRRYYSYETYSIMLHCDIVIHVISQTETDNMQFSFYQDRCYMIRREDETFSEEEIAKLKEDNDWDLPIVSEKLSYTDRKSCFDRVVFSEDLESDVLYYLKLDNSYGVLDKAMEKISDKVQLFFVKVFSRQEDSNNSRYYLIAYQSNKAQPIIACEEIPFLLNCQDSVSNFRKSVLLQLTP